MPVPMTAGNWAYITSYGVDIRNAGRCELGAYGVFGVGGSDAGAFVHYDVGIWCSSTPPTSGLWNTIICIFFYIRCDFGNV